MITLKQVNKAISHIGDIALYKGKNYFYFDGHDVDFSKAGVYVNTLNELSIKTWIEEAKERIKEK